MNQFIAYYRVSTKKQSVSGLGLDGQKEAVRNFVKSKGGELLKEFKEVESGKNDSRKALQSAINEANQQGATLLIAKLDRLSRSLTFISQLMDSRVKFTAVDMPEADNFTIHIFAALAQKERELISTRTKAALARKKEQGAKLGNPNGFTKEAQQKARETKAARAAENVNTERAVSQLKKELRLNPSASLRELAGELNALGLRSARGGKFYPNTVNRILKAYNLAS